NLTPFRVACSQRRDFEPIGSHGSETLWYSHGRSDCLREKSEAPLWFDIKDDEKTQVDAMAHGKIDAEYVDDFISASSTHMVAAIVMGYLHLHLHCSLGIVGSRVVFLIIAWCIQMRGSLFVSIFNPLMLVLVLVAVAASFMLDEQLYLRSVIGVVLIVCGLYMVLWGKNKEMKKITQLLPSEIIQLQ
ncbi:hypothetical protein S245_044043, partial [Arachis hypogaea]